MLPTRFPSASFDRPRWTEQEARTALAALQHSGKAVGVFAAEQGLDPQRLYSWRLSWLPGPSAQGTSAAIVMPPAGSRDGRAATMSC